MFNFCNCTYSIVFKNVSVSKNKIYTISVKNYAKYYAPPKVYDTSEWPPEDRRRLRQVEKQPFYGSVKPPTMPKMLVLLRGPELVQTELIHKGWGVKALMGGRMKYQHFEAIRRVVNKKLDVSRMFAIWRVDPPWQPLCKKGIGKKLGGGKGPIHHYCTPVRANRMVVELAGDMEEVEARLILAPVAEMLPFAARYVSQKDLEWEKEFERRVEEENINPYTFEYVIKNNMGGCRKWLSKYDYLWFGKYK